MNLMKIRGYLISYFSMTAGRGQIPLSRIATGHRSLFPWSPQ
jgi:hypothetical protein